MEKFSIYEEKSLEGLTFEMSYRIKVGQDWGEGSTWWTPVCRKVETYYFRIFQNFVGLNHFAGFSHQLLPFQAIHSEDLSRLRGLYGLPCVEVGQLRRESCC